MKQGNRSSKQMVWTVGISAGVVVVALLIAAYTIGTNSDDGGGAARPNAPTATPPAAKVPAGPGKELFAANCGACHALKAAGASGDIGPSLDALRPDAARVEAAIADGGTGSGMMAKGIVTGAKVKQVAEFVAAAAASR